MSAFIKQGGVFKKANDLHVKDGGVFKDVLEAWVKEGGVFKKFWPDVPVGPSLKSLDSTKYNINGGFPPNPPSTNQWGGGWSWFTAGPGFQEWDVQALHPSNPNYDPRPFWCDMGGTNVTNDVTANMFTRIEWHNSSGLIAGFDRAQWISAFSPTLGNSGFIIPLGTDLSGDPTAFTRWWYFG